MLLRITAPSVVRTQLTRARIRSDVELVVEVGERGGVGRADFGRSIGPWEKYQLSNQTLKTYLCFNIKLKSIRKGSMPVSSQLF